MSKIIADPRIDTLVITVKDITAVGHCVRGTKKWFEGYGFDFRDVVKNGVPARELLVLNDAHANKVVLAKLKRMG